jgi:hypothetical protein
VTAGLQDHFLDAVPGLKLQLKTTLKENLVLASLCFISTLKNGGESGI